MRRFSRPLITILLLVPISVAADVIPSGGTNFKTFASNLIDIGNTIVVPLLFSFAALIFLWGVFQYFILGGADEEKRKHGRTFALWGLLALAIMFSTWGLVRVFLDTFGLQ